MVSHASDRAWSVAAQWVWSGQASEASLERNSHPARKDRNTLGDYAGVKRCLKVRVEVWPAVLKVRAAAVMIEDASVRSLALCLRRSADDVVEPKWSRILGTLPRTLFHLAHLS
jgi:hypothetical protein